MTRTLISIQMQTQNADGFPAKGTVSIRPTNPAYAITVYSAGPESGVLDTFGRLTAQSTAAIAVFASDDTNPSTGNPFDTIYNVVLSLYGQEQQSFNCYVPGDSTATELAAQSTEGLSSVTLTSLIASNAMLGQAIVGDNWPDDTVVTSVSTFANTVTLSNPATVTGTCEAVVGGAVLMETLEANAL
jgi:hypothetical protein